MRIILDATLFSTYFCGIFDTVLPDSQHLGKLSRSIFAHQIYKMQLK